MRIDKVDADVVPKALRTAAGWSWRLLAIGAALYVLLRVLAEFRVLVVPLLISLLLVALVRPLCEGLHRLHLGRFVLPRALAAALTVLLSLAVLGGLITLISQQYLGPLRWAAVEAGKCGVRPGRRPTLMP
jgi:predicted PurR-regulated permease PerM